MLKKQSKTTKKTSSKISKKNKYEKMADRGSAFRSPKFSRVGLVGKDAKKYNDETTRDFIDSNLDESNLDIDVIDEGFGKKNILIKRGAKKGKNNRYDEKDVVGRFSDCGKLSSFISGFSRAIGMKKKK